MDKSALYVYKSAPFLDKNIPLKKFESFVFLDLIAFLCAKQGGGEDENWILTRKRRKGGGGGNRLKHMRT
jgi:hypothetical protein